MTKKIEFEKIKKILVIKMRHHGDVLLTTPLFSVLKQRYPHLHIDVYLYQETIPMLEGHPGICQFYGYNRSWKELFFLKRYFRECKLLKQLRNEHYDLVINLTEGDRGAIVAKFSGAKWKVGVDPEGKGMLGKGKIYTHIIKHTFYPRHTVEKNLDALRVLGIFPTMEERKLLFHVPQKAKTLINRCLEELELKEKQFVLIHPVSRWLFKCLPEKTLVRLIQQLDANGETIVLTSSPDPKEQEILHKIQRKLPYISMHNLGGKLTLKEFGALIQKAKALISVDSVSAHLASAMQIPLVVVFGPTSEKTWGPWHHRQSRVVTKQVSCRPCFRAGCSDSGKSDCLEQIEAEEILQAYEDLHISKKEEVPITV